MNQSFYEKAWDLLVEHAGASKDPHTRDAFVWAFMNRPETIEWRFGGSLGFGGKFWRNGFMGCDSPTHGPFYVSYYPEDRDPKRDTLRDRVNVLLKALYEEHRKEVP